MKEKQLRKRKELLVQSFGACECFVSGNLFFFVLLLFLCLQTDIFSTGGGWQAILQTKDTKTFVLDTQKWPIQPDVQTLPLVHIWL